MPPHLLPSLLIQLFAVGYTPGPANLYALSASMTYGRKAAFRMWWGLVCGFLLAAVLVAVMMHFVGEVLGEYVIWLKYLGAVYILYLSVKMILYDISVYSTFVLPYSDRFADLMPVCLLLMLAGPGSNLVWLLAGTALNRFIKKHRRAVNIVLGLALAACALMIVFWKTT